MRTVYVYNVSPKGREESDTPAMNAGFGVRALPPPLMNWGEERPGTSVPVANAFPPFRPQDVTENERNRPVSALPAPNWNFGSR